MRWPASSGIRATGLCIRSRMTALTWFKSAETKWIIGSSEGVRAEGSEWSEAVILRRDLRADGKKGKLAPRAARKAIAQLRTAPRADLVLILFGLRNRSLDLLARERAVTIS